MTSDSIRKTEAAGSRGRCESLKPHLLKERKEYKAIARTFDIRLLSCLSKIVFYSALYTVVQATPHPVSLFSGLRLVYLLLGL